MDDLWFDSVWDFLFFCSGWCPASALIRQPISGGLFWYYVAIAVVFNSFYTIVNLPYTALTPELTQDYDERTSLNSYRFAFSISGSILSLLLALAIFNAFKDDKQQQYLVLGAVCAFISILPLYWCVWGTRKRVAVTERQRQETSSGESLPYLQQLKIAFTNRPFLYVIGIYLCSWLAVQNTVAIIPYFVKNWMKLGRCRLHQSGNCSAGDRAGDALCVECRQ